MSNGLWFWLQNAIVKQQQINTVHIYVLLELENKYNTCKNNDLFRTIVLMMLSKLFPKIVLKG